MEVHTTTITITTQINNIIVITCLFYLQMMNDKNIHSSETYIIISWCGS